MVDDVNRRSNNGFLNLGATEDDGSSIRPDFVISVQPQNHGRTRAELPVSTVDWRSNPRGQFIPTHGLDFLIGVSNLLIQQTVELDDLTSKIESENRYIVRIPNGEALYIASEASSPTQRCVCGSGRAFTMHLHDNTRQEAMVLKRRLAGASCLFPCRLQEMKVITPPGDYVGRVQQRCTWMVPVYRVRDAADRVLFIIEGPAVLKRSALMLSEFKILTADSLREVGKISHGWDRELVSFATTLQIPDLAVQPKHKCLLLAASFLLVMVKSSASCPVPTNDDKIWIYEQYYTGERDTEQRKNGHGENHWTGAESLEWYTGRFLRGTMHGVGEYRSRHRGDTGVFVTYEGHFYANRMHGYGAMSYPNGAVFTGLFHNDVRWGPGIESQPCLREDVGLWRGTQLVRLAWRPPTPNVALDLNIGLNGKACVEPHRILLTTRFQTIGEVNSAIELLKQSGAEPISASENWIKLYPKNCTDLASQLCHVEVFDSDYFKNRIPFLEEVSSVPEPKENESQHSEDSFQTTGTFYAWNNNEMITHIMKHCFKHEKQRNTVLIDLSSILSGPRNHFKRAGKHELDSRTLIMASYLGHIANVAQLVNELNVHPNIADIQGNTALMYAACGDQVDTIHFLVEAGADINSYNDTCCTPLGVTLMRFACARKDIAASGMVQALIPPPIVPPAPVSPELKLKPSEWYIVRENSAPSPPGNITRSPSKLTAKAAASSKKVKPSASDEAALRKKTESPGPKPNDFTDDDADETFAEEKKVYTNVNTEFSIRITDLFSLMSGVNPIPYIFEINDMVKEVEASEEDQKKPPEKVPKKVVSKVIKDTIKPSKEIMWQTSRDEFGSIDSADKAKIEMITNMMSTILQLLSDGADPTLVRCPQPALLIATVSGCPDLVRHMVHYGVDVNEVYSQSLNYTALDVAVSRPLTYENIDLVRALLECGAKPNHRLRSDKPNTSDPEIPEIPGPTLLHAVLARKTENETEEDLRRQLLELLLEYSCDPMVPYRGRSATDVAMTKNMDIFDIFVKCSRTDLKTAINDANQTVLVKMFSTPFCKTIPAAERLQTVTNLLLFGADPLLECRNGGDVYENIFVFARKTLTEMESTQSKPVSPVIGKGDKGKKAEKPKKEERLSVKSLGKLGTDDVGDYKQALDVMTECARILYVRWLQAKLLKELIKVVDKFKHRQWNMILPEHKNKKSCGLWLTCARSLEIWDTLKTTRRKVYEDKRVLKHILCLVQFYSKRSKTGFRHRVTAEEKDMIESKVKYLLHDHKVHEPLLSEDMPWARPYVMPELALKSEEKFNVCFECALPFDGEQKIQCASCKLVSFCSFECIRVNIDRTGCHPCSEFLKNKYFPSPDESEIHFVVTD